MMEHEFIGDPAKAAKAMIRVAGLEDPPVRIQLGTDSLMLVKIKAARTIAEAEKWAEIAHSTDADDVDRELIMQHFAQAAK